MEPKKQVKMKNKDEIVKKEQPKQINTATIKDGLEAARLAVQAAFVEFHKLLFNKRLDKNKSTPEKEAERSVADKLFKTAQDLDKINPGEGVLIAASIALRELLTVRDRLNEIEYLALLNKKELKELAEKKTDVADEKKQ